MWSPRWGFESNSKNKPRPRPPRSPCVVPPSALWGPQNAACYFQEPTEADRSGTRRAARRGAPIQAPARTKAAGRQQQLFFFFPGVAPSRQPPSAPQQECGRMCVCVCVSLCHWRGQPAAGASLCSTRMPAALPVPRRSPGSARLNVCQTEESPIGRHCRPASRRAHEKLL